MAASATRFFRLLEVLVRHGVEFLIAGGVAGLLEGAPILTLDLEYEVEGLRVRALDLQALIEAKERANREKDRAVLPILRRTLQLRSEEK